MNLKLYFDEIGQYPLLTKEEELQLAYKMRSENQEEAQAAREQLVCCNLRLVVSIAKAYRNNHLDFCDLIMEGNSGLMTAVDKYNPDLGYRFSTCATPWIKQAITKAIINSGRTIRIPAHIYQLLSKYRKVRDDLFAKYKREATREEIAKVMNIDVDKVDDLETWRLDTVSLSTPIGDDEDDSLLDLQPSTQDTPFEFAEKQERYEAIMNYIHTLKPRTQTIMKMRYGIGEQGDPDEFFNTHTLEEIGAYVNLSRERVRQIERQTLNELQIKLKHLM